MGAFEFEVAVGAFEVAVETSEFEMAVGAFEFEVAVGRLKWLWWLDAKEPQTDEEPQRNKGRQTDTKASDCWQEYIVHMELGLTVIRIIIMTTLFFFVSITLLSFDWPYSPHRGTFAASFNYALQLILLLVVMALLFAAIDASQMAARLFSCFKDTKRLAPEPTDSKIAERYPVGWDAIRWFNRFLLAAKLSTSVNRLIYMPFLALLLLVPARSQLFDAWNIPLPHAALFVISLSLAVGGAMRLRLDARDLRKEVLRQIDLAVVKLNLSASRSVTPPAYKVELLKRMEAEIRENREGAFRPLLQEPVIRGILFLLGGAGGVATAEFLLLRS